MGGNNAGKKRPRSYYKKCMYKKRKRWNSMDVGMQGFLVTCNKNESQAVKEMYNLFNEYAENLYGPEQYPGLKDKQLDDNKEKCEDDDDDDDDDEEEEDEDIEKALEKEVCALKKTLPGERRFQQLDTGAKNCLFIKTTLSNPCELIHAILKDVYETQIQKSRFALRVLPIQTICRANVTDISNSAQDLFEPFFRTSYGTMLTYGISFKARMTCKVTRDEVINSLCQIICEMNPLNKVNYSNPDLIVLVEVLRGLCCLSVVKDFNKFRKYNLQETARAQQSTNGKAHPTDNNSTAPTDSTSKSAADTASKSAADTASKSAADTASKSAADTASKSAADTTSKSTADTTSKSTADTASKSAADTASKSAADTASKSAADTASKSAADTASTSAADTASTNATDTAPTSTVDIGSTATGDTASTGAADTASTNATDTAPPGMSTADTASTGTADTDSKGAADTTSTTAADTTSTIVAGTASMEAADTTMEATNTASTGAADTASTCAVDIASSD